MAVVFLLLLVCAANAVELFKYDPQADPAAVVVVGNVRFTMLTDNVVRMQYSPMGQFEDRRTIAIVNRKLPVPQFTHTVSQGLNTISLADLTITYLAGASFSSITVTRKTAPTFTWSPGTHDTGNLFGTVRTLDGIGVNDLNCTLFTQQTGRPLSQSHCAHGVVSRAGWAVVNDTGNPVLDDNDWWAGVSRDAADLYLFGHGHDYKQAILDLTLVGGKVAMVPRFMSGIFWTRWLDINNADMRKIVTDYSTRAIPLDLFILDMDWHMKNDWTGYTFDARLFPFPTDSMQWLKSKGLATAANIHDASGVNSWEHMYAPMATAMGKDPSRGFRVDFAPLNQTYMNALQDIVMQDLIDKGLDLWWTDWQQGETYAGCAGGAQNPTIITNMVRGTNHLRRGEKLRDVILARFGGLGSHRYQVGFSGDVAGLTWANLAFQPYFSSTASNVAFGFWSHDIEGPSSDIELYVRWVQWGAFSGAFRAHERGMSAGGCADSTPDSCSIVEIYNVPKDPFEYNRAALQARARLVPYIYTRVREAFDSGLGLTRPMYYDYPELPLAYSCDKTGAFSQYMYGPDLLVAPVVNAANASGMAPKQIWLPPGQWIEHDTGALVTGAADGSTVLAKLYDLSEIPVFVRAGALIPSIPVVPGDTLGLAKRQYTTLEFTLFLSPDSKSDSTRVYEDDGATTAYLTNEFVWTTASYTNDGGSLSFKVASEGSYPAFPTSRTVVLRLMNTLPPSTVTVAGTSLPYARYGGPATWTYDGDSMAVVIEVAWPSTAIALTVDVSNFVVYQPLFGLKGAMQHAVLAKRNLNADRSTVGENNVKGGYLQMAASQGDAFAYLAGTDTSLFKQQADAYRALYAQAVSEVASLFAPSPADGCLVQLFDSDRHDHTLCGSTDCVDANNYYDFVRVEGWMPTSSHVRAIPLNDYWNADTTDNWATTQRTAPSGYTPATFANGWVLSQSEAGTAPLQLFFSDGLKHHMTVATQAGIDDAHARGFRLVNATLGHVYTAKPADAPAHVGNAPPRWRWQYSMSLMQSGSP